MGARGADRMLFCVSDPVLMARHRCTTDTRQPAQISLFLLSASEVFRPFRLLHVTGLKSDSCGASCLSTFSPLQGPTGCTGCFWFLLSTNVNTFVLVKTSAGDWLGFIPPLFLHRSFCGIISLQHRRSFARILKSKVEQHRNRGQHRGQIQTSSWFETPKKCTGKNARTHIWKLLLIYGACLGEKLGEEVSAAGEQHVPKPVFIESIGEAAACVDRPANIKNQFVLQWNINKPQQVTQRGSKQKKRKLFSG